MTLGMIKEVNIKRKEAMFNALKQRMEEHGVYLPLDFKGYMRGNMRSKQVLIAAVMEVYTPSGLYDKPYSV